MFPDFFNGLLYVFRGLRFFYRTPALWKYSLVPFLFLLLFYLLLFYLAYRFAVPYLVNLLPNPEHLPGILRVPLVLLRALAAFSCCIAVLLISLATLTTGYELAGSLFFDAMTVRIERLRYHHEALPLPFRKNLACAFQSASFSIGTLCLSLLLLPAALLIPVIGVLPMLLVVGYRQALTCLFSSGFSHGLSLPEIRERAGKRKMLMTGFGVTIYLLYLIPFAGIVLLPGFTAAGALLYNEEFAGESGENGTGKT